MAGYYFVSLVLLIAFPRVCAPTAGVELSAEHLFSVGRDLAAVIYRDRPTPVLAVDARGNIAFPLHVGTVGIFNGEGELVRTAKVSGLEYPSRLGYQPDGTLLVEDAAHGRTLALDSSGQESHAEEDWLTLTRPEVAKELRENGIDTDSLSNVAWDDNSIYVYSDLTLHRIDRETGRQDKVVEAPLGFLIGALGEAEFLFLNITNDCYVVTVTEKSETSRRRIEEIARLAIPSDAIGEVLQGNSPESNKLNRRKGWYWDESSRSLYKVLHVPSGFHFLRYRVVEE